MRISQLKFQDFKSYKGEVVVPFDEHLSAIIGPNGCGKSNIMDGICFVLGLPKSYMRVATIDKLICWDAEDEKRALVEITFIDTKHPSRELRYSRSVQVDGRTPRSTFRIGNKIVSAEEYESSLVSIGVTVTQPTSFLIQQGSVMRIAEQASVDLTALIEELSGSGKFRKAFIERRIALEEAKTRQFNESVNKRTMQGQAKALKHQVNELKRYNDLKEKRKDCQEEAMMLRIGQSRHRLQEATATRDKAKADIAECVALIQSAEKTRTAVFREAQGLNKAMIETKAELAALDSAQPDTDDLEARVTFLRQRGKEYKGALKELAEQLKKEQADNERDAGLLDETDAHLKALESTPASILDGELADEYAELKKEFEHKHADLVAKANKEAAVDDQLEALLTSAKERVEETEASIRRHQEQIGATETKRAGLQQGLSRMGHRVTHARNEVDALQERLNSFETEKAEIQRELRTVDEQLGSSAASRQMNRAAERARQTVTELRSSVLGVYGTVSDLIRPKKDRETAAVVVGLGRHVDSIVVDTLETANKCMELLRLKTGGRRKFLPLETIRAKAIDPAIADRVKQGRGRKMLYDAVTFEENFKTIAQFVCQNTVLAPTIEDAQAVAWPNQGKRVRTVAMTKRCELFLKSGTISTSGNLADRTAKYSEAAMGELRAKRDALNSRLADHSVRRYHEISEELQGAQGSCQAALRKQEAATNEIDQAQAVIEGHESSCEKIRRSLEALESERDSRQAEYEAHHDVHCETLERLNKEADRFYKAFIKRVQKAGLKVQNVRDLEGDTKSARRRQKEERMRLVERRERLKTAMDIRAKKHTEVHVAKAEERVKTNEAQLADSEKASKAAYGKSKTAKKQREALEAKLGELTDKKDDLVARKKASTDAVGENKRRRDRAESLLSSAAQRIADHKRTLTGHFNTLRMQNLELTGYRSQGKRARAHATQTFGLTAFVSDTQQTDEDVYDDIEAFFDTLNFKAFKDIISSDAKVDEELARLRGAVKETQAELDAMVPNHNVEGEFDHITERLGEHEAQLNEVAAAVEEAERLFQVCKKQRTDLFVETANDLSAAIQQTYAVLTGEAGSVQGKAEIQLESDDPFVSEDAACQLRVMPPRKRYISMSELSGGEKTMAALALIFAMRMVRPAPFFVMDEVDAALDQTNVTRLVDFITGLRHETQVLLVSLKTEVYETAQRLVGVTRPPNMSTQVYVLDNDTGYDGRETDTELGSVAQSNLDSMDASAIEGGSLLHGY
ncbi:Structural maintenance of chromosome subunit SMC1 [Carpediemonas membranifera]|uniref:Structural maintenance of chromosomes protein n=1 Tax=Carpediemonas membranifera TaxID=201153 RepID=A0A8J6BUA8_9EUKA|nr:Structural maintenance of chromosome subunit SMC1 [Carpediemonas membranifera]|eukprot:KAG9390156.1 Structural maintenance of chromosome subunit SMC1 [Carpediemonas membranifera]